MKKISIILGLSLIITGLAYIFLSKEDEEENEDVKVREKEKEKEEEKVPDMEEEIKNLVLSGNYCNPGELVLLVINENIKNFGFSVLQSVPKNIEEMENWIDEHGIKEDYEKILEEKYKREK